MYLLIYVRQGLVVVSRLVSSSWSAVVLLSGKHTRSLHPAPYFPPQGEKFPSWLPRVAACSLNPTASEPEASLPASPQKVLPASFPSEANIWDIFEAMSLTLPMRQLRVREGAQSHTVTARMSVGLRPAGSSP